MPNKTNPNGTSIQTEKYGRKMAVFLTGAGISFKNINSIKRIVSGKVAKTGFVIEPAMITTHKMKYSRHRNCCRNFKKMITAKK